MIKERVLVFPCGSEIGLEIYRSLKFSKDFDVVGASSVDDHGKFTYETYVGGVPDVTDNNFIQEINELVTKYQIKFIFPAHDSVVVKLAQHREELEAVVLTAPTTTCEISRSKRLTYEVLASVVRTPVLYDILDNLPFPIFLKPDVGQGSKGTLKAQTRGDATEALRRDPTLLLLEYLPGREYTVDCFTDSSGVLLYCQARQRRRVSNGISVNSHTIERAGVREFATRINETVPMRGAWFFQVKEDAGGELALLEIAPRIAGTMAVARMSGANLPLLTLYDAMGVSVTVAPNNTYVVEVDRALESRFSLNLEYDKVYVDLDDTLVVRAKVNELLLAFLYRCVNEGKSLILLTRHAHAVDETLRKYRISSTLFDRIEHLRDGEPKSTFVSSRSIFIDDSFQERQEVFGVTGVPVFDVSEAVELF